MRHSDKFLSPFIFLVQTGILSHVAANRTQSTFLAGDKGRKRKPLYTALQDALVVETYFTTLPRAAQQAEDFVKWAVYGTQYAWITGILGERSERPY